MKNKEIQTFGSQTWLIVLFSAIHLVLIYQISDAAFTRYIRGESILSEPSFLLFWLFFLGGTIVFFRLKLTTQFTDSRIDITYWPFLWKPLEITGEQLKSIEVRTYKPLLEFGGWGYRIGWNGYTAYSTHGKTGVFMEFHTGKKIMVGTQKPDIWQKWIEENYSEN